MQWSLCKWLVCKCAGVQWSVVECEEKGRLSSASLSHLIGRWCGQARENKGNPIIESEQKAKNKGQAMENKGNPMKESGGKRTVGKKSLADREMCKGG